MRITGLATGLLLVQGLTLWVANGAAYVAIARQPNRRIDAARHIAEQFSPEDLLVFGGWSENYIEYFAGMETRGMLSIYMNRRDGESTFESLALIVEGVRQRGGSTFMEVPPEQEPWVQELVRERADLDFSEEDLDAIRWGRTISVAGREFREIDCVP